MSYGNVLSPTQHMHDMDQPQGNSFSNPILPQASGRHRPNHRLQQMAQVQLALSCSGCWHMGSCTAHVAARMVNGAVTALPTPSLPPINATPPVLPPSLPRNSHIPGAMSAHILCVHPSPPQPAVSWCMIQFCMTYSCSLSLKAIQ